MRKDNVGPGPLSPASPERRSNSMREFDTLPAPMRKILAEAPFDFATRGAKLLVEERGIEQAVATAKKNIPRFIEAAAKKDYGPDHPQSPKP